MEGEDPFEEVVLVVDEGEAECLWHGRSRRVVRHRGEGHVNRVTLEGENYSPGLQERGLAGDRFAQYRAVLSHLTSLLDLAKGEALDQFLQDLRVQRGLRVLLRVR